MKIWIFNFIFQQQQKKTKRQNRFLNGVHDSSLSFDSTGSAAALRLDPFAPAPTSLASLASYEVRVDGPPPASAASAAPAAPWNAAGALDAAGDTSTFDRLRDTCNKMFLRDRHLRASAQFTAVSPTLPRVSPTFT